MEENDDITEWLIIRRFIISNSIDLLLNIFILDVIFEMVGLVAAIIIKRKWFIKLLPKQSMF